MESGPHPYIMYDAGTSTHRRPVHESYTGLILPEDNEFRRYHLPPEEYGCACGFHYVSEDGKRRYERDGVKIPPSTGGGTRVKTKAPPERFTAYINERGGTVEKVPDGVHPSFNYDFTKVTRRQVAGVRLADAKQNYEAAAREAEKALTAGGQMSNLTD